LLTITTIHSAYQPTVKNIFEIISNYLIPHSGEHRER